MENRATLHTWLFIFAAFFASHGLFAVGSPTLDARQFPAGSTKAETILRVPSVGRYSISSTSKLGARIELVDRMAGTMAASGQAEGVSALSGRIDSFLEPGEYKVRIQKASSDVVALRAAGFSTVNAGSDDFDVPELLDLQGFSGTLDDLEIRSWWIKIGESDTTLRLEMQGRCLADAVLWKDGVLETGARPFSQVIEREKGKPLVGLEFNTRLEPGSYLLICAGGPKTQWAKDSNETPFTLKRGARYYGELGMTKITFDDRGSESFLVSGRVGVVQIEAANNKGYRVVVTPDSQGGSRYGGRQAVIDEKSTSYRATTRSAGGSRQWVTVQGPVGETVEVRWISDSTGGSSQGVNTINLSGGRSTKYMATMLGALEGEDSIDVTGFALDVSGPNQTPTLQPKEIQTLSIDPAHPVRRRVNALSTLSFILKVDSAGYYAVSEKDPKTVDARFLFQLLDDRFVRGGGGPVEVLNNGRTRLQNKLYSVTVIPVKAGVLDFAIFGTTVVGGGSASALFAAEPPVPQNGLYWPSISPLVSSSGSTYLVVGARSGVPLGVAVRELPLDLSEPVCVKLDPGDTVQLPFAANTEIGISSSHFSFTRSNASIDGAAWSADRVIAPGGHTLSLSNPTREAAWHVIGAVSPAGPGSQKPRKADLDRLFPAFAEGRPVWRDFDRGETAGFLLHVSEPASYRVSTSGRLAMGVSIRTVLRPNLFSVSRNADGRNAAVTQYLRPGTYIVQATAQERSQGRAGVTIERLDVLTAGTLTDGEVLRSSVPAGAVLGADVKVEREGDYGLECLGLGRSFAYRFEDSEGWPIGDPVQSGTLRRKLFPGIYHYISFADQVGTRRLLSLSLSVPEATDQADIQKAKLVAMELNRTYHKVWVEAEGRPEDVLTLTCPAEIHGTLLLSDGMLYSVADSQGSILYQGLGGKPKSMELPTGAYRIGILCMEVNNLTPYTVSFSTADLYAGRRISLTSLPIEMPVTVGTPGSYEIWSYGTSEVDAVLIDSSGKTVIQGLPIPDDWSFRIVTDLKPGRYTLLITSAEHLMPGGPPTGGPLAGGPSAVVDEGTDQQAADEGDGEYRDEGYDGEAPEYDEPPEIAAPPTMISPSVPSTTAALFVEMLARGTIELSAAKGTIEAAVDLAAEVAGLPFTPAAAGLFKFSSGSQEPLSASVDRAGRTIAAGPCPLFIPLSADASYRVRFWRSGSGRKRVIFQGGPVAGAYASVGVAEIGQDVKESACRIANPGGLSFSLASSAPLLYSPGTDRPFGPVTDAAVNTVSGTGWVMRSDAAPIGTFRLKPLRLTAGVARGISIGVTEQVFTIDVPPKTVALVRTDNAGSILGLSAQASSYDWRGAAVDALSSVVGMRDGSFTGRIWAGEQTGSSGESRRSISAELYPVSETAAGSGRVETRVAPGSAIAFPAIGGVSSVTISLEKGMTAFGWNGKPLGAVDASREGTTGRIDISGGSIVVVNASTVPALCAVTAMAEPAFIQLSEGDGYEAVLGSEGPLSFNVSSDRQSRLFVWGAKDAPRFFSEDDERVSRAQAVDTEMGTVFSLPAGKGRLEVIGARGPFRAWVARPDAMRAVFAGRDPAAWSSPLPAQGVSLGQGPQSWSFSVDRDVVACLTARSAGVTALSDRMGALLKVSAGVEGRTLLASLAKGSYTAFTRPFRGQAQGGSLRLVELHAVVLDEEGEGDPTLIGPGDLKLYTFEVKAPGKVGAGIKVERDGLSTWFYDAGFSRIAAGSIFIHELPTGTYYMLVQSGEDTQTFTPLVYGLSGSRTRIPDDVVRSYREE